MPSRIPIAAQTTDDPIQAWSLSPTVYTLSLESTEQDTLKAVIYRDLSRRQFSSSRETAPDLL